MLLPENETRIFISLCDFESFSNAHVLLAIKRNYSIKAYQMIKRSLECHCPCPTDRETVRGKPLALHWIQAEGFLCFHQDEWSREISWTKAKNNFCHFLPFFCNFKRWRLAPGLIYLPAKFALQDCSDSQFWCIMYDRGCFSHDYML